jgi:hypothetical protein
MARRFNDQDIFLVFDPRGFGERAACEAATWTIRDCDRPPRLAWVKHSSCTERCKSHHPPMKDRPFGLIDWHRFLFGNASQPFLLEVLLRTSVTYVLLIVAMRLLGRRVAGQYTLFEISSR